MLVVTDDAVSRAGADEAHVHGIVNHVRGIRGVEVATLVRMSQKTSRAIFRSRGHVDMGPIAVALGGKGTKNAASVTLDVVGEAATDRVRDVLNAMVTQPTTRQSR